VLIAGLLREPQLLTEEIIRRDLDIDDLYDGLHRIVYGLIWDLIRSDEYIIPSPLTVWELVQCRGMAREFPHGEPALWLLDVLNADPTGAWCYNAISLILEMSARREAIRYAAELASDAQDGARQFSNEEK
jgi:hypothetical protein